MKITARQAVTTTAKMKSVSKQLDLIQKNLVGGIYASRDELVRVRGSVMNASKLAKKASDDIMGELNSIEALSECHNKKMAEKIDDTLESATEVGLKASILGNVIDTEINAMDEAEAPEVEASEEEEVTDDIVLDDDGAEAEDEDVSDVEDDEDNVEVNAAGTEEVLEEKAEEPVDLEASEDEDDDIELEEADDEGEAPAVEAKKASAIKATKKASVVKRASVKGVKLGWSFPSLKK